MLNHPKTAETISVEGREESSLEQFRTFLTQAGYSRLTSRGYLKDLFMFAEWFEGARGERFEVEAITPMDLRDYKSHLMTVKGLRPATVNRKLIAISAFCRFCQRSGAIVENPAEEIRLLKKEPLSPHSLNRSEQNALVRAVAKSGNKRDALVIHLLLGAGLRLSELASLKRSDMSISNRKGSVRVRMGKGMKAREVPLNRDVRKVLEDYLAIHRGQGEDPLLFGQRGPLKSSGIWEIVKKYTYQARVVYCSPHMLRHTFAKNLVDAGVSLDKIAVLLGHESLDTTKIYTRPAVADLERAVDQIALIEN